MSNEKNWKQEFKQRIFSTELNLSCTAWDTDTSINEGVAANFALFDWFVDRFLLIIFAEDFLTLLRISTTNIRATPLSVLCTSGVTLLNCHFMKSRLGMLTSTSSFPPDTIKMATHLMDQVQSSFLLLSASRLLRCIVLYFWCYLYMSVYLLIGAWQQKSIFRPSVEK